MSWLALSLVAVQAVAASQPELQRAWDPSHFTNPAEHRDDHFQYLVHASAQAKFYETVLPTGKVSGLGRISVSLINQNHIGTFRNAGVILSVPSANIITAKVDDMGSCSADDPQTLEACFENRFRWWGLPSPPELLQSMKATDSTAWNEVLVSESPLAEEDPRVVGLFVRADSFGNCLARPEMCLKITELSRMYKLPLVKIPPPKGEVWLIGYPAGGTIETPFGYFFRWPPFSAVELRMSQKQFELLEQKVSRQKTKLFITSAELVYGAAPIGKVVGKKFFHITSVGSFKEIKRLTGSADYEYSDQSTRLNFNPTKPSPEKIPLGIRIKF